MQSDTFTPPLGPFPKSLQKSRKLREVALQMGKCEYSKAGIDHHSPNDYVSSGALNPSAETDIHARDSFFSIRKWRDDALSCGAAVSDGPRPPNIFRMCGYFRRRAHLQKKKTSTMIRWEMLRIEEYETDDKQ